MAINATNPVLVRSYTRSAIKFEDQAARYLRFSYLALKQANEMESLGRDGDAYLSRENAYFMGLDATASYREAKRYRDLAAKWVPQAATKPA